MESNAAAEYRELAYRANDGIEVVLLWHQGTDELLVRVSDGRSGAYFELAAGRDQALEVFNQPYAHAVCRGLPDEELSIACWAEASATGRQSGPGLSHKPTR